MELVKEVYRTTKGFPSEEKFGLVNQMRRAAVSVPSNIAEGHARGTRREYLRFLSIAMGSLAELETQLTVSEGLGFLNQEEGARFTGRCEELRKMLHGLSRKISVESEKLNP